MVASTLEEKIAFKVVFGKLEKESLIHLIRI